MDEQDYPPDPRRGKIAGFVNDRFRSIQRLAGGDDYDITFFGSQKITINGRR